MDYLHITFAKDPVLLPGLELRDLTTFLLASLLAVLVCVTERLLTFAQDRRWCPSRRARRSRVQNALWRTLLYWMVTFLRLLYMIIAMSCHLGLILITTTTLAFCQFFIELATTMGEHNHTNVYRNSHDRDPHYSLVNHFRSGSCESAPANASTITGRRPKPEHIFIHPANSNVARADAVAQEMGYASKPDVSYGGVNADETAREWGSGQGRDVARQLMSDPARRDSNGGGFTVGEDDDDETAPLTRNGD
ncbi:hypothetical protein BDV98DRAFT_600822 [Pterulicium gracile]|uniref:Copper transporter n=1 Tax=Pterulicium gracile TaxID=1884261 RepID=A0A5C3QY50_9AGAR|nr:hypothetical protein BDV98DRAFT_600822 [Pterula gracilis]